jgi:hypothetical protein
MPDNITVYTYVSPGSENESVDNVNLAEDLLTELHSLEGVHSELLTGSKSIPDAGTIITKIIEAGGVVNFLNTIFAWLTKDRSRSIKLQIGDNVIEASGLTPDEQERLIAWFQLQTGMKIAMR